MTMHNQTTEDTALQQASIWFARLTADDVTAQQRTDFINWVSQSSVNQSAYQQICATWGLFDELDDAAFDRLSAGVLDETSPMISKNTANRSLRWIAPALAIAASLVIVFVSLQLSGLWPAHQQMVEQVYATKHGQTRSVMLADGSTMKLNTDTELRFTGQRSTRTVILDRGEVFFDIAPDSKRPFIVRFGTAEVRVLGTAFNIYRQAELTQITVEHGRVQLSSDAAETSLILSENFAAYIDINGKISPANEIGLAQAMAWRDGNFIFGNSKLSEVVYQINRYVDLPILIEEEQVKNLEISGVFAINRIAELLNTLELIAPVTVERQEDGHQIIRSR